MKHRIYVVGMGPGQENMMTQEAMQVLEASDVIIGYTVYLKLLGERFGCKELLSTPMRQERERCQMCFEKAREGKKVALICSGDAGIYGMASLMLEIGKLYDDCIIEVIPGITAASSGAAVLGAPLNHDFCVISLSDLLTPWELITRRLAAAAEGDFAICLYNPSSHKRHDYLQKACQILLQKKSGDTMKKGDILLEFDIDKIKADGYDVTTPIIISNTEQFAKVKACEDKVVTKESKLLSVQ